MFRIHIKALMILILLLGSSNYLYACKKKIVTEFNETNNQFINKVNNNFNNSTNSFGMTSQGYKDSKGQTETPNKIYRASHSQKKSDSIPHNDKNVNFDFDTVYQKNPLSTRDVDILLDFAEDYTAFCYEYLSDNYASLGFKNIDDWENTLVFAKKGMDIQKREWKENYGEEFDPFPEE